MMTSTPRPFFKIFLSVSLVWSSTITGCWSAGGVPSAAGAPSHFLTSNKLGHKFQPPRPSHSPDYDSLMARVSGDFGVKSAIVRAAKRDPEYKGVETLVVPLYIPKGAVPISLERIPRSRGAQDKSAPSAAVRALSRRTRLPPVASKRREGSRRTSHPTPPPSYLRGWGRRILPKADSRIGLQSDSEASESQALESDLPELIRSKKNQNSRLLHIPRTSTADNRGRTESSESTASPSSTTEAVATLRLRRGPTSKPAFPIDDVLSSSSINGVENTSQTPTTDILLSNQTIRIPIFNLKSISGSPNFQASSTKSRNVSLSQENGNNKTEVIKPQRRPLLPRKPNKQSLGHFIKTVQTTTSGPPPRITLGSAEEEDAVVIEEEMSSPSTSPSSAGTTERPPEHKGASRGGSAKVKGPISKRRLPFPLRAPPSLRSNQEKDDENKTHDNSSISSKLRLPFVSTKSNFEASTADDRRHSSSEKQNTSGGNSEDLTDAKDSSIKDKDTKSINSSTLSVPIPVRRRRPLRTKLPIPESTDNAPRFPLLSAISSTTAPSTLPQRIDTTHKSTIRASSYETNVTLSTTSSPDISLPVIETSTSTEDLNITVSSTPPEVRKIHEFFRLAIGRSRQTNSNSTRSAESPHRYYPSKFHSRTTVSPALPTDGHNKSDSHLNSSVPSATATTPEPASKTPADIVLAGFSDVMRATNAGSKDRFREITSNLDMLNKQLAERGILIIHAEIEGKIIKLRNLTRTRNGTLIESYPRHNTHQGTDKINHFKEESEQVHSLPGISAFSPTVSTPSENIDYDISKKDDDIDEVKNTLIPLSPDLERKAVNNFLNEVSTVRLSETPIESTQKPNSVSDADVAQVPVNGTRHHGPFSLKTESFLDPTDFKINSVEIVSTISPQSGLEDYDLNTVKESEPSTPPSTLPSSTLTSRAMNSNTTSVEASTDMPGAASSFSTSEEMDGKSALDPSKLSRIRTSQIAQASGTSRTREFANANEKVGNEQILFIEEIVLEAKADSATNSAADDNPELMESENGSSVYLVGMVGIFPLAGVAAYVVRRMLRGDSHKKALPESEERPDGFTPPTQHHARPYACLTAVPDQKVPAQSVPPEGGGGDAAAAAAAPPPPTPWEFNRSKLRLVSVLGEGNFGVVWKAEARGFCDYAAGGVLVAVKRVKEGAGAKEKQDLLRELSVMQLLGPHPNVVSLLGCCTQTEPHLVIMEYVMFGKLLTFLRDHRTRHNYFNFSSDTAALTSRDLTRFACQVATGCDYLQSRGIIHRDLAARNILVDHNKVCKIADFGMARSIQDIGSDIYEQKSKGALPIRWMAPESLYMNIFTHKSDVWSFGILCWEIVTLGATPYPGLTAREVMRQVTEGYRLERPHHCKAELYKLLATCWQQDLHKRPSFHHLKVELSALLEHQTGYIDLENFPEEDYFSMHQNNDEKL